MAINPLTGRPITYQNTGRTFGTAATTTPYHPAAAANLGVTYRTPAPTTAPATTTAPKATVPTGNLTSQELWLLGIPNPGPWYGDTSTPAAAAATKAFGAGTAPVPPGWTNPVTGTPYGPGAGGIPGVPYSGGNSGPKGPVTGPGTPFPNSNANTPKTTPTPTTPAPTTPTPTTPAPTTPTPTTNPDVVPGWEQTGAPTQSGAPAGVQMVMPMFDQQGQFIGYSTQAGSWGNATNMASYYPSAGITR